MRNPMNIRHTVILFASFFSSCNSEQPDGWQLANEFHEKYASEFVSDKELLKYNYNPRTHFFYLNKNDSSFRCIVRDSAELLIINFDGFDIFKNEFGIEIDSSITFKRGFFTKDNSTLTLAINDTTSIGGISYRIDPISYFAELNGKVQKYGIVTCGRLRIGGIIQVYLTATDYLLYFPSDLDIEKEHFNAHWRNKKSNGQPLDLNWYYYKAEQPLDFG